MAEYVLTTDSNSDVPAEWLCEEPVDTPHELPSELEVPFEVLVPWLALVPELSE